MGGGKPRAASPIVVTVPTRQAGRKLRAVSENRPLCAALISSGFIHPGIAQKNAAAPSAQSQILDKVMHPAGNLMLTAYSPGSGLDNIRSLRFPVTKQNPRHHCKAGEEATDAYQRFPFKPS